MTNFGQSGVARKQPKLSDGEIIQIITYGQSMAVGFAESKLSKERERVQLYYDGDRPHRAHKGDSGYMSLDVYDGVESMKAQLLEVFSANNRPVKFRPDSGETDDAARIRTEYVSNVIFDQNPGYAVFHDVIEEGLLFRNGICKVWWDSSVKDSYVHLSKVSAEELTAWLARNPDAEVTEKELHEDGVTIERVTVRRKKDTSQVRIKLLAGEEFGISPMAESIEDADLVYHRHEMTASALIKAGYDRSVVEGLQSNDRLWLAMEPERIARFQDTDDLIGTRGMEDGQPANRVCMVYENYLGLDVDGDGTTQLYKVTTVGNTILDKEPVDRRPFVSFCPLRRSKAFWGHNYAKMLIHTQNARTYLTRSIVNHTLTTVNPRLMVVNGAVKNPRELMENRFGGLVNVSRPDGIVPLMQSSLNPFVFQTIQMLDADKEEITGISQLSQGLNKDAVSKQNSQGMIQELITVSQIRQKIVARNFAEHFLRPLYVEVYRLVLENEDRQKIQRIAGGWSPIPFDQWPEDSSVEVSFALGYGEAQKEAMKWITVHKTLESVPALAGQYTPAQQYQVIRQAMVNSGITDIDNYLLPPQQAKPLPPNPLQQAELQMKQADAQVKQANAQAAAQGVQLEMQKLQMQHAVQMAKLQLEQKKLDAQIELQRLQFQHKLAVDGAELMLEQQAAAQGKVTGVAEPSH